MQTTRKMYRGHDIRVTRYFDGLKNALSIDGKFTGDAGFSSIDAAFAYGEKIVDGENLNEKHLGANGPDAALPAGY